MDVESVSRSWRVLMAQIVPFVIVLIIFNTREVVASLPKEIFFSYVLLFACRTISDYNHCG